MDTHTYKHTHTRIYYIYIIYIYIYYIYIYKIGNTFLPLHKVISFDIDLVILFIGYINLRGLFNAKAPTPCGSAVAILFES